MKRCPECRRDYYDDTLSFCLEDGTALVQGSVPSPNEPATAILSEPGAVATGLLSGNEPATAILSEPGAVATGLRDGDATRPQIHTTDQTAIFPSGAEAEPQESLRSLSERQSHSANRAAQLRGKVGGRQRQLAVLSAFILAVVVLGGVIGYRYFSSSGSGTINSIAVLPFENRSGSSDTDYLSDGLADSLIYRLSQLPDLKVSPTSSVMRYKGKGGDSSQIAKELDVDAVMSGRLVQIGDSLNISVQLTDARTDKLIWAEQYDRKMSDLLATQREIATAITQKLQLKLSGDDAKGITKKYTDSNEAYQLYMKGRFHFAKRTLEDMLKSIEYFQQAIALDPNFALAFSAIAESYNVMPSHGYRSPSEVTPPARAAVEKALAIDPSLAEAHTQLGSIYSNYDWDWAKAESEYKQALEIDPNNATAHLRYGQHLWATGRLDEAIGELSRAVELEPLSLTSSANLCLVYLYAGQKVKALELARKNYDLEPNFITGRLALGSALIGNGMYDEAIRLAEQLPDNDQNNHWMLWIRGLAYARSGRRQEAEGIINRFKETATTQYVISYYNASIYAALGEKEKAFAELEKSFDQRDWWQPRMKQDPAMATLRDDPRFAGLLKRMGLPE